MLRVSAWKSGFFVAEKYVNSKRFFANMACNIFFDLGQGVKMPALGYGTWQSKDAELEKGIDSALEAGYRYIDTAAAYENEDIIGNVLNRWFKSGKLQRKDLFLVSKLPPARNRPTSVSKTLKKTLQDLQTDYLDLYLVHTPFGFKEVEGNLHPMTPEGRIDLDTTTDPVAVWKEMEKQVDAGLTKTIGISNFNIAQITRILNVARIKPANLQIELHLYHQQNELVAFCKNHGISITAYSSLGTPGLGQFLSKLGLQMEIPDILHNPVVKEIADKHKKTPAQVLLRHIVQKGVSVIPKSVTPERIRQNINIFDFVLDEADLKKLNALDQGDKGRILDFKIFAGIDNHPEYPF